MNVISRDAGGVKIFEIHSKLEAGALKPLEDAFAEFMSRHKGNRPPNLLVDLRDVKVVEDAGMRQLVEMRVAVTKKGGKFKLWNPGKVNSTRMRGLLAIQFEIAQHAAEDMAIREFN